MSIALLTSVWQEGSGRVVGTRRGGVWMGKWGRGEVLSAVAQRPANGAPAMLRVGWSTAYETADGCSVRWVGPLVRIGDLPSTDPF